MKQLLRFVEIYQLGKTRIFDVFSNHSNDHLGRIHWRSGWRCYVMSYSDNIDMSLSCNIELNKFMHELEDRRKANLTKNKKRTIEEAMKYQNEERLKSDFSGEAYEE